MLFNFLNLGLPKGVSHPTWVVLDISGSYPELDPTQPLQALLNKTSTIENLQDRADALADSEWLHGVLVKIDSLEASATSARAIHGILQRLAKEKRVIAYTTELNMTSLLVASGAKEIVAPESADVLPLGFGMEQTFMGKFLKNNGIDFENLRIKEYKAALTTFSENEMDAANREQLTAYVESAESAWVSDIAKARGVSEEKAQEWLNTDFFSAEGMRSAGLIDKVAYEDELMGPATRPLGAVIDLLSQQLERPSKTTKRIAVVPVIGSIVTGKSKNNNLPIPLFGGKTAGSDTVVAALKRAKADKTTAAIVVYVDSPGGSPLASDLIHREIVTSTKPVVVVMGDLAASGGYYVAAGAKHIVASPYTITGSIGIVSGKPVLERFNEKYGFKAEQIGKSGMLRYSSSKAFSDAERSSIETSLEDVYQRFIGKVAAGRGLSKERVHEIGRGRIWSGKDALAIGLVDELGDLYDGINKAVELAEIDSDYSVWTASPKKQGLFPEFLAEAKDLTHISVWPFGREQALAWLDLDLKLK